MADTDRTPPQHLTWLARVGEEPMRYGVWPVLRAAEARAHGLPRIGHAKRPDRNVVDLAQEPQMGFAQGALSHVKIDGGRARVSGPWMGLTGPMGPLPTHLTEFAFYEARYSRRRPFGDWLNLLAGRMLQLFYRSWADSQPAANADRPDEDAFARFLEALSGAGEQSAGDDGKFAAKARVHYASVFSGSRSAVAIEDAMTHLLGQQTRILEFQARWRALEPEDYSALGGSYAQLGRNVVLGRRVRSASDAFRIVIRAANLRDYQALLPTGARFAVAAEALDAFKPSHIEWDMALELAESDAPPVKLDGRAQLGWSGWVKRPAKRTKTKGDAVRADAHLRRIRKLNRGKVA
jgi:type VI secretion system ImpH/TssG family protein